MGLVALGTSFGDKLRLRRQTLGLSQLRLALSAGVSPRHLSFVETGRSRASREMVLRLAEALRVPLREQNALLLAAGFAPAFEQHALDAPELGAVRDAAARVLDNHEPFPAIALDRRRNVVMANRAAQWLNRGVALPEPVNIYRLLLHPEGLAPRIVGFDAYAHHLLTRLRRDADASGDPELHALLVELESLPNLRAAAAASPLPGPIALTLRLREGDRTLSFLTMLATFGTPFDVTVSELLIESLFPADEATARALRARDDP